MKIITAGVSAVSLYINTYFKSYDLKSLQKKHKGSAIELLEIREDLMSVLCDVAIGKYSEEELFKKRDEFLERKIEIAKNALDAGDKAVKEASNSLKIREDNTYSDNEIDSYLPILARKNK